VLYQKPLVSASLTHLVVVLLTVAVVSLWFSLVGSILHNFLESAAVREEAHAHGDESVFALVKAASAHIRANEAVADSGTDADDMIETLELAELQAERSAGRQRRARKFRHWEFPASVAAVILFVAGYLWPVVYVFLLAFSHDWRGGT
jgi:hypothetical protein